jgi:antitoxin MazE
MRVPLRKIGNSSGVIVPRAMLLQLALGEEVEMAVEKGAIVLRRPSAARAGWVEASVAVAAAGEDSLAPDAPR